jgi:hypothetical protein
MARAQQSAMPVHGLRFEGILKIEFAGKQLP